ncbi:nudix domain protein [Diaporthe amygdali]|uniref:nudix domain protein n=1 Tax=Phomopsis amygdali TaxID=1214568 RepID=UPI0022FF07A4|nr:nudix domain protein [Diaporthe amygdali]KAJ0107696.1 nudix domain protein [Diaporthe amygdali]
MAPPPPPPADFTFDPSLSAYNVLIHDYLSKLNETATPKLEGLATGAVVFSTHHPADQHDRVLLIQRASHDSMPNRWEIPGGAVDADETVLGGLAREVWEESGLKVSRVASSVSPGEGLAAGAVFRTTRGRFVFKLTFVVDVEDSSAVMLDPNEHQDYVWATEEECRAKRVERSAEGKGATELVFTTAAQEEAILTAFEVRKRDRTV